MPATALRLATTGDVGGEPPRSPARRRGDALVDPARFHLDHREHAPSGRHRPHLDVVVDWAELRAGRGGELVEGGVVDGATVRRLLCDASVHRVVTEGRSTVLDDGTATRTVSDGLFAAPALRDRHCRHDGCDRPPHWCEAHHVVPVLEGGPTSLDNLGAQVQQAPPHRPPARVAGGAVGRRHPGGHRPRRANPHHPTAGGSARGTGGVRRQCRASRPG